MTSHHHQGNEKGRIGGVFVPFADVIENMPEDQPFDYSNGSPRIRVTDPKLWPSKERMAEVFRAKLASDPNSKLTDPNGNEVSPEEWAEQNWGDPEKCFVKAWPGAISSTSRIFKSGS